LSDLIVSPVNRIERVSVDKLEGNGVVAGIFHVVFLAIKAGAVAEIAREADPILSVRLDLERHPLPQSSLAQILCPLTGE
jgi:hypothetical protein